MSGGSPSTRVISRAASRARASERSPSICTAPRANTRSRTPASGCAGSPTPRCCATSRRPSISSRSRSRRAHAAPPSLASAWAACTRCSPPASAAGSPPRTPFYGLLSHEHGILHAPDGLDRRLKPVQPLDAAPDLRCPLLAFFGDQDEFIPGADIERLRAQLAKADAPSEIVVYPGAAHAFMNDTRPAAFRPELAKRGLDPHARVPAGAARLGLRRPRQDQRQRALAGREAGGGAIDGDRRAARVAQPEREAARSSAPSVIASRAVDQSACAEVSMKALASTPSSASRATPSSAPAAGFASTSRPDSASIARKASQMRSMAATTARRLPRGAPRARRAVPVGAARRGTLEQRRERLAHRGAASGRRPRPRPATTRRAARARAARSRAARRARARSRCRAAAPTQQTSGSGAAPPPRPSAGLGPSRARACRPSSLDLLPACDQQAASAGACRHAGSLPFVCRRRSIGSRRAADEKAHGRTPAAEPPARESRRPAGLAPMARTILAKLGYRDPRAGGIRAAGAALGRSSGRSCGSSTSARSRMRARRGSGRLPLVVLCGRHGVTGADPRIVGAIRRPAGLHEIYRLVQQVLEDTPRTRRACPRTCRRAVSGKVGSGAAACSRSRRTAACCARPSR